MNNNLQFDYNRARSQVNEFFPVNIISRFDSYGVPIIDFINCIISAISFTYTEDESKDIVNDIVNIVNNKIVDETIKNIGEIIDKYGTYVKNGKRHYYPCIANCCYYPCVANCCYGITNNATFENDVIMRAIKELNLNNYLKAEILINMINSRAENVNYYSYVLKDLKSCAYFYDVDENLLFNEDYQSMCKIIIQGEIDKCNSEYDVNRLLFGGKPPLSLDFLSRITTVIKFDNLLKFNTFSMLFHDFDSYLTQDVDYNYIIKNIDKLNPIDAAIEYCKFRGYDIESVKIVKELIY